MSEPRTEEQERQVDYLVAYGQARAANQPVATADEIARLVQHGKALQRAHAAAVLKLELRP